MSVQRTYAAAVALAVALAAPGVSLADPDPAPPAPAAVAAAPPAEPAAQQAEGWKTEDDDHLSAFAGRGAVAVAVTEQELTAVNTGNTVSGLSVGSGDISLRDNSFADFNGLGNVTMNTGHNNNLQSTVSVTIIMAPASGTP